MAGLPENKTKPSSWGLAELGNKSNRAWLTRYTVSAVPTLRIESGRYTRPVTPVAARLCRYCYNDSLDDENMQFCYVKPSV